MTRRRTSPTKEPIDEMMVGFYFPGDKDKTPYDYLVDPETGLRKGQQQPPQGLVRIDLSHGISGVTLPPLAIWRDGKWGNELQGEEREKFRSIPGAYDFETWIVSGEGTPSNYEYRVYSLPETVTKFETPKHPVMWTAAEKKGKAWTASGYGSYGASKTKQPAATLPIGIRFRCPGCGHWWKESTLAPHTTSCCPGLNDGISDWAIMCECCDTLDEVSACKPGFPRPPKVKEVEEEKKEPETATAS